MKKEIATPQEMLLTYFDSYLGSIVLLLNSLKSERSLIFPITFLLSHYLELWIKNIGLFYDLEYFDYTFRCLNLVGHNIYDLIINEAQMREFESSGITKKEIDDVLYLLDYFDKFTNNNTNLSIAMRYPISIDNKPTINMNILNVNIDEYINNVKCIVEKTMDIYDKFFKAQFKSKEEELKVLEKFLKQQKTSLVKSD